MSLDKQVQISWDEKEDGEATGVAILTLNDPKRKNALTVEMGEQFLEAVGQIREDTRLRAVVLRGAGDAFSAGGDFRFLLDRTNDSPVQNSAEMRKFYDRFLQIRSVPVPTIAAMHGPAIGAGLCLALACDLRICAEEAKLGATFVGLGLHPGMGATHFLPQLVGPQVAGRLMLTGEVILGWEAQRLGLVLEALPTDAVIPRGLTLARQIAAQGPVAVRSCVRSLRNIQDRNLEQDLWREADAQAHCYATADLKIGLDAIRTREKPRFTNS
jgi:enoyl-CoA hydratase